ncbi:MAG: type II secretion system F family protein [Candidatus Levybacteria bacterium]|nr:type II secretion system F family protein [Candidatus Levybacteria bacterium]
MANIAQKQLFSRVTFLDKLLFTKHMAVMLKSGITVAESLDTLAAQTKSESFKAILLNVSRNVKNGQSLGKSLALHHKVFDQFYVSLIDVSEQSGTLEQNLEFLAEQLAKDYALRKKIQGAMLYPAIVFTAVTVIGASMSLFVLPKLIDLFESLDVTLPITTKILLFFAGVMQNYGYAVIGGFFVILTLLRILTQLSSVKPRWHGFLLSLPILGPFLENEQLAFMCRNLGVMLKSGLPIRRALEVQEKAATNLVFASYIANIKKAVNKGKTIESELSSDRFSKISPIAVRMIGVGEKTGKLDETLLYLGDFFDDEVDNTAKNLSTILEPVILLVIGAIVGFVALAIISPIYELAGSIRR